MVCVRRKAVWFSFFDREKMCVRQISSIFFSLLVFDKVILIESLETSSGASALPFSPSLSLSRLRPCLSHRKSSPSRVILFACRWCTHRLSHVIEWHRKRNSLTFSLCRRRRRRSWLRMMSRSNEFFLIESIVRVQTTDGQSLWNVENDLLST